MLFSDKIPSKLQEYPNVSAFSGILDALQDFKSGIIAESLRVNNAAVLMDKKWLLKMLEELGVSDLPMAYPVQIMQQYLLNADTVLRTRGSKIGVELYCSLLSLGEVSIDDNKFYEESDFLLLDSLVQGYITGDNRNPFFYLVSDSTDIEPDSSLTITVKSRYFNGSYPDEASVIKGYLENTIKKQLGFSNARVTFKYQSRTDFYYHKLLNQYFV